ncbi:MAG: TonB-dependent receptor [Burkholderiales bacterium]|nr:TonB-dependent receptor [Burkholderiales bacterium]MCW5620629.1 TonB-dependent receptor [Burkholderiales bacterium]
MDGTTTTYSSDGCLQPHRPYRATLSARYNHTRVKTGPRQAQLRSAQSGRQPYRQQSTRASASRRPENRNFTLFGSWNQSARAPSLDRARLRRSGQPPQLAQCDGGRPLLDQVIARTFEGGVRGRNR